MTLFEQFAFHTPLYASLEVPKDLTFKAMLCGMRSVKVDGFCPECGTASIFSHFTHYTTPLALNKQTELKQTLGFNSLSITCARNSSHKINFWFLLSENDVVKVGQYPSLADIANDEAATYRDVLDSTDAAELHRAIGLAAHGVGIGSFVYLRRIFERLIYGRFNSFKEEEGWAEADFSKLKMDEKVKFLKGHIPNFLYENRELYSILSKGIHELSDKACLAAFKPLQLSIKIILDEDKKKKEELELQRMASAAIKQFNGQQT